MDKENIKNYLYYLGKIYKTTNNFHHSAISFIDLCEESDFMRYMESSKFQTSISLNKDLPKGRFIHYLRFKNNLPLKTRKIAGYLSAYRIIKILKSANFPYTIAQQSILACGNLWKVFPNTIASAEWDMKKKKFDKFTFYIVCGKTFGKNICEFWSRTINFDIDVLYKMSRNIDFLGIDFYDDGNICFKIYNRFPINPKFIPEKWEEPFIKNFNLCKIKSALRVCRFFSKNGKILENDKTDFLLKGIKLSKFKEVNKSSILNKLNPIIFNKEIETISVDRNSQVNEIYFW